MPERWRSDAARQLVRAVRAAGGTVERNKRGKLIITGPGGVLTLHEPAGPARRDLRSADAAVRVTKATGLELS